MHNTFSRSSETPAGWTPTKLIPTRTPNWAKVLTQFGISEDSSGPEVWAHLLNNFVNVRAMAAIDVWLEWIGSNNMKIWVSDEWAKKLYVLVADA